MSLTDRQLALKSIAYRRRILDIICHAGAGHTGGSLSCVDILNVLYNRVLRVSPDAPRDPNRDRYIQSKGHSVEALYVVLADRGFFPADRLATLCGYDSPFVGHPTRDVPGIEHNTGALGHGLSFGVGCAIAARQDRRDFRTFVLLGDGELAEGSNWRPPWPRRITGSTTSSRSSTTTPCRSPAAPATCAATSRWTKSSAPSGG